MKIRYNQFNESERSMTRRLMREHGVDRGTARAAAYGGYSSWKRYDADLTEQRVRESEHHPLNFHQYGMLNDLQAEEAPVAASVAAEPAKGLSEWEKIKAERDAWVRVPGGGYRRRQPWE